MSDYKVIITVIQFIFKFHILQGEIAVSLSQL